jgi:hypothetical protein
MDNQYKPQQPHLPMTLNVSLRIPDGIVLASDSLATTMLNLNVRTDVRGKCESCGHEGTIKDVQLPTLTLPGSTWPYVQKIFPIGPYSGLAIFGSGSVNGRSQYNHIIGLVKLGGFGHEGDLEKLAEKIRVYFQNQLLEEWKKGSVDANLQPDNFFPFGYQLVGFKKDSSGEPIPLTLKIKIGKASVIEKIEGLGCTPTGDESVVSLLWPSGNLGANIGAFSLQDALDYAKFLIKTTADYQRFSGRMPTVGGEVDMALVTAHKGFQWIAQKELYRKLEE